MAILCRKYNLLFIMTPRTACTAVGELLLKQYGGKYLPEEDILDQNGTYLVQKKHCTLSELLKYNIISKDYADSLTKFTTVRNPFDNIVSLFIKKKFKYKPLLDDPDSWVYKLKDYVSDMKYAQNHSFDAWIFKNYKKSFLKKILGFRSIHI